MSQQIGRPENRLPEHISEIHFGFLSGKYYIGAVDAIEEKSAADQTADNV